MGAPGRPEKKSERKREAARRNARLPRPGGRKVPIAAEQIVAETLDRLRALGPMCAEFLERTMADPRSPVMAKVTIAREIFDRAGWPRQSEQTVDIGIKAVGVKFLEINHAFKAPVGWNGAAVEAAEALTAPWFARPAELQLPPADALPAAAAPARAPSPTRASAPSAVVADGPGVTLPPPLAAAPRSDAPTTPTPRPDADGVPGASGALEVVGEDELRRRQAERDARELEALTADDETTAHQMFRASRGYR